MADYNIYIHAIGTGSATSNNPTIPWSARGEGSGASQTISMSDGGVEGAGNGVVKAIMKATGYASNPDSIIAQAWSALGRAFPIIAVACAVVQLGDAIATNVIQFGEIENGDYRMGTSYSNLKIGINNVFHPASTVIQSFKTQQQWKYENKKHQAERDLLGDSVINSYTNRGV